MGDAADDLREREEMMGDARWEHETGRCTGYPHCPLCGPDFVDETLDVHPIAVPDCYNVGTVAELARVIRIGGWRNVAVLGDDVVARRLVKAIRDKIGRAHVVMGGVNELRDLVVLVNGTPLPEDNVSGKCQVLRVYVPTGRKAVFWSSPSEI
jgi:hypothetical protein